MIARFGPLLRSWWRSVDGRPAGRRGAGVRPADRAAERNAAQPGNAMQPGNAVRSGNPAQPGNTGQSGNTTQAGGSAHAGGAVQAVRIRCARDLHDEVIHNVTAMVVQAEAARYLTTTPERLDATLAAVAETGRHAVRDLRHLLEGDRHLLGDRFLLEEEL